eukprot:scaffold97056_cov46-Cyclotella_meneghiniana.AAC.1
MAGGKKLEKTSEMTARIVIFTGVVEINDRAELCAQQRRTNTAQVLRHNDRMRLRTFDSRLMQQEMNLKIGKL